LRRSVKRLREAIQTATLNGAKADKDQSHLIMVENQHIAAGKFHGVIAVQTPIGSFGSRTISKRRGRTSAMGLYGLR